MNPQARVLDPEYPLAGALKIKELCSTPHFALTNMGCRHSSVDSSGPSILLPLVWVPSTPLMILVICVWIVACGKYENELKKRPEKCLLDHDGGSLVLILHAFYSYEPSSNLAAVLSCFYWASTGLVYVYLVIFKQCYTKTVRLPLEHLGTKSWEFFR